jgi:hypothetical protein
MAMQSETLKQSQRSSDLDIRLKAANGIDSRRFPRRHAMKFRRL